MTLENLIRHSCLFEWHPFTAEWLWNAHSLEHENNTYVSKEVTFDRLHYAYTQTATFEREQNFGYPF